MEGFPLHWDALGELIWLGAGDAVGDSWMLQSHVPALGLEEGSSGRKGLEGEEQPRPRKAPGSPRWFIGVRGASLPAQLWCPTLP